ncbi:SDR family NAD(P)-dependent oxidoreductase [Sphingomonas colocasiae]|uniref:SDR family oxidoreductase n=1 Tax=Sphingomonas colocasiae TaxID=1848973 RepID=A0ABS7PW46_9SPHN|nr:SDR family NAD(P)-dependent oxidoreductase [Sphingomonas colocasiae]MBY8825579.1 SDR family oxidoreductase [Sphingomonas colocasiae]
MTQDLLTGRVALVTGGSSGIGEAVARKLASAGAHVAVVASHDIGRAEAVAESIGERAAAFVADVRDPDSIGLLVSEVEAQLGPIDILVNSAGVYFPTPADGTPSADAARMIDINLKGAWTCISAVAPGMKARRRGRIVNMASVAGVMGVGGFALYSATKAGIVMMTRSLARELAPFDINVNAVAPGNTATPMNAEIRSQADITDAVARMTPSTTAFTAPEEIAEIVLFLVGPGGRPMHGTTLLADEGLSTGV